MFRTDHYMNTRLHCREKDTQFANAMKIAVNGLSNCILFVIVFCMI